MAVAVAARVVRLLSSGPIWLAFQSRPMAAMAAIICGPSAGSPMKVTALAAAAAVGFVATSDGPLATSVAGGANGVTFASTLTEFPPNGATKGNTGATGGVVKLPVPVPERSRSASQLANPFKRCLYRRWKDYYGPVAGNQQWAWNSARINPGPVPEYLADLPAQVDPVLNSCSASSGNCAIVGNQVEWDGSLAANQIVTIEFRVRVRNNVSEGTNICIDTKVNYDSDGNGSNDTSDSSRPCIRTNCPPVTPCVGPLCPSTVGPGDKFPLLGNSGPSDQKPASVLVYPIYTSSSTAPNRTNTSISVTNTSTSSAAFVHLFFVNGSKASV